MMETKEINMKTGKEPKRKEKKEYIIALLHSLFDILNR